jgi:hypothetical protein
MVKNGWFAVVVDDRVSGVIEGNRAGEREVERIRWLRGVDVRPATAADLCKFRASSAIPARMLQVMARAAWRAQKRQERR